MTKLYAVLALLAALALAAGYVWRLQAGNHRLTLERDTAVVQAAHNAASARIGAEVQQNIAKTFIQAQESRDAVREAPDFDSSIDRFDAGLDGLRASGHAPVNSPHDRRSDAGG